MYKVHPLKLVYDGLVMLFAWIPVILFYNVAVPFSRGFYCDDETIRYPYKESTVSSTVLYTVGCLLPTFAIIIVESYRILKVEPKYFNNGEAVKSEFQISARPVHPLLSSLYVYLGYFYFGMALTFTITDLGKYAVGRLRPNFIAVCQPDFDKLNCTHGNYIENPFCTNPNLSAIKASRLSFPSGHSSFSAYTMAFLVMYLQSRLIWPLPNLLLKHLLQFLAAALAYYTGLSRVSDNKHHWSDVLGGWLVGVLTAILTALYMLGLFRRPHYIFAFPAPYDSYNYNGAQLSDACMRELIGNEKQKLEMQLQS